MSLHALSILDWNSSFWILFHCQLSFDKCRNWASGLDVPMMFCVMLIFTVDVSVKVADINCDCS